MEPKLSKYLTGFHKNHYTQHTFLKMIKAWRSMLNKGIKVGAIIMDLSQAFDTLNHSLLPEAAAWRCFVKTVFLEISQNSQENTCGRVSFLIKLQVTPQILAQVFSCKFCEIFKNTFFDRTPSLAASVLLRKLKTYGFNTKALTLIQSYFSNSHQRTKVDDKFRKWQKNFNRCVLRLYPWPPFSTFLLMISFFLY